MMKYFNLNYPGLELIGDHVVRKEVTTSLRDTFLFQKALIRHFILRPDPMVVPVHHFEIIKEHSEDDSRFGSYVYAYEMMRLGKLEDDEKKIIETISPFRGLGFIPTEQLNSNPLLINGKREYPKLIEFMKQVLSMKRYWDVHGGNFLKDDDGDYRIIDLEGFLNPPLEDAKNNWITR